MTQKQLDRGVELSSLIETTKDAIERLETCINTNGTTSFSLVNKSFAGGLVFDLDRKEGNEALLLTIRDYLKDQLVEFQKEWEEL